MNKSCWLICLLYILSIALECHGIDYYGCETQVVIEPGLSLQYYYHFDRNKDLKWWWFRNGEPILTDGRVMVYHNVHGCMLNIKTIHHSDTGLYFCMDTEKQEELFSFHLKVLDKKTQNVKKMEEEDDKNHSLLILFGVLLTTVVLAFLALLGKLYWRRRHADTWNSNQVVHFVRAPNNHYVETANLVPMTNLLPRAEDSEEVEPFGMTLIPSNGRNGCGRVDDGTVGNASGDGEYVEVNDNSDMHSSKSNVDNSCEGVNDSHKEVPA